MQAAVDTQFGGGKYSCLGKPIAMMELHKMVFKLLRHFDVALMDSQRFIKVRSGVFMSASNFWVKLDKRAA
ncbi:uncharacterized protein F5Z01DRAFT_320515 [Emericellopsis atlantica]|uniref:Cytochrome P450 n=1 Tax=Emericellopsis atlantica TaxID=2614577 RepID=A0A9P7ZUZ0_9HYPO|nr:uncharacterized protein F5Z01DRAFT_320515 [Emericellopsis atlantica]KAG9258138.1 hypothetical protein F5Z01DRAFT_320515 [Emericellopsis atlantica]